MFQDALKPFHLQRLKQILRKRISRSHHYVQLGNVL